MMSLADFQVHAKEVLSRNSWYYYSKGGRLSLRDNVEAYSRYRLRPRVLRDVSKIDMRVQLFGEWVEFPICVAPTAMHKLAHPEGEVATARACSKLGTCMTLSTWSTTSLEEVASCSNGLKWFQTYMYKDKELAKDFIKRAERSGYKALVFTIDDPNPRFKLQSSDNTGSVLPPHLTMENFSHTIRGSSEATLDSRYEYVLDWNGIDWVRGITDLPIVVKGILTREDAIEAVKHGVQGILVSNHGARQLDGVPATIDVLSEVVEAVGDKVEVFLDGGVRQGTDVLKAVALGAKAVFIGRPVLWGLAYKGSEGVENVLTILRDELKLAMMLAGCAKISDISPDLVVHESHYKTPQSRL